jgi:hypothetical protein
MSLRKYENRLLNDVIAKVGAEKQKFDNRRNSLASVTEDSSPRSIMRREIDPNTKVQQYLKRSEQPKKLVQVRVSFSSADEMQEIKLSQISSVESIKKAKKQEI